MANNLFVLIKLDTDTMAFTSLVVSILGAIAAIIAAFYANVAAFYAKKAATRRDPSPAPQNTQPVEHPGSRTLGIDTPLHLQVQPQPQPEPPPPQQESPHLHLQPDAPPPQPQQEILQLQPQRESSQAPPQQEAPRPQAQSISISVEGEAIGEVPLELLLTLQDSSIRVSRVETLNAVGKALSSSPAKATDNAFVFKSILAPQKMRQWWSAGDSTAEPGGRSVLRVYLLVGETRKEIHRDIPVSIVEELRSVGIASMVVWTVKGSI